MARIPSITTVAPKQWRILQRPGVLVVGAVLNNNPSAVGNNLTSVGVTDTSIMWNPNIEVDEVRSDQLYNAHGVVETQWGHQFTLSLDQSDVYNLALAMSYDQDAVSSSSMLTLDGQQPSPYRSVQVQCLTPKNVASDSDESEYIEFYKAKITSDGSSDISRESKSSLPLSITAIANSGDIVGAVRTETPVARPDYETIILVYSGTWTSDRYFITPIIHGSWGLCNVTVHYDATIYQDATVELVSGSNSSYDTVLRTFLNAGGTADNFTEFGRTANRVTTGDSIRVSCNVGANNAYCRVVLCMI